MIYDRADRAIKVRPWLLLLGAFNVTQYTAELYGSPLLPRTNSAEGGPVHPWPWLDPGAKRRNGPINSSLALFQICEGDLPKTLTQRGPALFRNFAPEGYA